MDMIDLIVTGGSAFLAGAGMGTILVWPLARRAPRRVPKSPLLLALDPPQPEPEPTEHGPFEEPRVPRRTPPVIERVGIVGGRHVAITSGRRH